MNFLSAVKAPQNLSDRVYYLLFINNEIAVKIEEGIISLPGFNSPDEVKDNIKLCQYIGTIEGSDTFTAELNSMEMLPAGIEFRTMRSLLGQVDDELFFLIGRAYQIINWDSNHQYCGRCGALMIQKEDERVKVCPSCQNVNYPRISPAVIVSVIRDGKILLANSNRFNSKMYSVLAGFVEAGETFEECVKREIKEEVNIDVKNIKYFGSQPWPFPDSLMVAFTAEYESGELNPDGMEILDAGWYTPDNLPMIPGKWSIARKLIDAFIEKYRY